MQILGLLFISGLRGGAGAAPARSLSGEIRGTLPAGLYRVTGNLVLEAGESLTVSPGVVLEFEASVWEDYGFDARGTLIAEGTAEAPIVFRPAPEVAEFNYLRLGDSTSRLRHCRVERAGRVFGLNEGGLWIDDCSPRVEDCRVSDGRWHGILVTGTGARPSLVRTSVSGCDADGIAAGDGAGIVMENCTSVGNGADGVRLSSGANSIIGCLVAGNGEDGIDCAGTDEGGAVLLNCTLARNHGEDLAGASRVALYNCLATSRPASWEIVEHTYATPNEALLGFADPAAGDYRLGAASPGRDAGTRFGLPLSLPGSDLDGEPRINGIVDLGAYESSLTPDTGERGPFFSPALLRPRMTRPEFQVPRSSFRVLVAALGAYARSSVTAELLPDGGSPVSLPVTSVVSRDLESGTDLAVQLYPVGIERVQEITVYVPAGAPDGLHGIRVRLGSRVFESPRAVRIHAAWPRRWGLLHVTDAHVGAEGEAQTAAERLRRLVREANFLQPEVVVMTGDLCENANPENAAWVDSLLGILGGLRVPVLALPGNHERYNENGAYNPLGYFRHFHAVNRFANNELVIGGARIYGLDSGPELGITELFRCLGPTAAALDWVESRLEGLDSRVDRPRLLFTHGPNYDYFSWNGQNTDRVRDIAAACGFSLCLAGHTHRFEAYRNEGTNWLGRNDYLGAEDWGQDRVFPGYPLHLQTSSLGKEEHLPMPFIQARADTGAPESTCDGTPAGAPAACAQAAPGTPPLAAPANAAGRDPAAAQAMPPPPAATRRGLLGDDIGFRWIEVENDEVSFFSADADSDGWRSTEEGWLLGSLVFGSTVAPDGTITSRVTNRHHETWRGPHHFASAAPGVPYLVSGGTFVHRYADDVIEVEVDSIGPGETSVVTLVPNHPAATTEPGEGEDDLRVLGNPFIGSVRFLVRLRPSQRITASRIGGITLFDPAGRRIRTLPQPAESGEVPDSRGNASMPGPRADTASWEAIWDGRDEMGRDAPPGVYFARLAGGERPRVARVIKLR